MNRVKEGMAAVPFTGLTGPTLTSTYVELAESVYRAGLEQPRHGHDPAYFTAVLGGCYHERIGEADRRVAAGALLFHPAGEEHAVRFTAITTRVFRIQPRAPLLDAARIVRARLSDGASCAAAHDVVARMRAAYLTRDILGLFMLDALACELVTCCMPRAQRGVQHRGALRARDALEAQLHRTLSLEQLAAEAGCHPITLTRAFRRTFGCSIGSYVRRRRLEEAVHLLRTSDVSISTIAARSGFADQAHLTRALRRATGRTPASLRPFKTSPSRRR